MDEPERPERHYWDLVEAAPDGILEVNAAGRIILCNRVAAAMFGYERDEILQLRIEDLVPRGLRDRHLRQRENYLAHPQTRPMSSGLSLAGLRRDGSEFPVEISLSPVAYGDGMTVIAVIHDVTDRRAAENKIKAVQERYTADLAEKNRELALRNDQIEKANSLKGEFLASMSHELRTPLHTIIGFSELLSEEIEGPLNDKQRRFVTHIRNDSQHLLELINDILDLSKIEAGRLDLRREEFNVEEVVQEVLSSIRLRAAEKQQRVEVSVAQNLLIYADRLRFKEILYNLLTNAVKFTPDNGEIGISCAIDQDTLTIVVWDTGVGIAQEHHESIFDKFHQVGSTTRGVREGTGLGLAITKSLVESHRGAISVRSELNNGATFTVRMPVDIRVLNTHQSPPRDRPLVLVVEDQSGASELLKSYLSASRVDTVTANDAGGAVQLAREVLPDVITLDLLIPGGRGWRVLSEVRRLPETAGIPIIVVSVLDERDRALRMGAADYLVKPVSREAFIAAVERHIHAANSHRR